MISRSLIAFDTDHIKSYVFGTSKLKEIRGASSILDHLNRQTTVQKAESEEFKATTIYANGGSALFHIDSDKAEPLGKAIQKLYREHTGEGASITYAIQDIPNSYLSQSQDIMMVKMPEVLNLLRWRLREAKNSPSTEDSVIITQPSHALLRPCSSCGLTYAEDTSWDQDDPELENLYCRVCLKKREENKTISLSTPGMIRAASEGNFSQGTLWERILQALCQQNSPSKLQYNLSSATQRPEDFNAFATLAKGKDYLGLIYADANGMGKALERLKTLQEVQDFAEEIDNAIFRAMGYAISKHLPVQNKTFPFDILLIGGDDIVMVTTAPKALQVAHIIAEQFYEFTKRKHTLSVGVVLAPTKYPFNLQQDLVNDVLKAAKKAGSVGNMSEQEQAHINFVVVSGGTSLSYQKIYQEMHRKKVSYSNDEFYATLRPYTLKQLGSLLISIHEGNKERLGRTKLHQLREAILKLNRTTTILEALSLLRNWKPTERTFIKQLVHDFDTRSASKQKASGTLFPWFLDDLGIYRTPLLDFIDLYDFVSSEEGV